ncbi:MAG: cell adhesion protein [Clostridium sp.]
MKNKKILGLVITFFMTITTTTAYADETTAINLNLSPHNKENYIHLDWNSPDEINKYSYMIYSKESTESEFQTIPAKSNVKVLNIYPGIGNNLKTWMETNGYGKGLISVDEVDIHNFNSNPYAYLKDNSGNWKYDVIYQGAWDTNNGKNLNSQSITAVEEYIKSGRGYLAGHDTIGFTWGDSGLSHLRNYFNIKVGKWSNSSYADSGYNYNTVGFKSTNTTIKRKGLLTNYPWEIGDVGTVLTIPLAHSTSNFALGDIWMTFPDNSYYNSASSNLSSELKRQLNFYLTTWNNCAMIQTGHSNGSATPDEQKVLANTLFYLAQITEETSWDDHKAQDLTGPTKPEITNIKTNYGNDSITFDVNSTDLGNTYDYYIESTNLETKQKINSEIKSESLLSGLKGYSVVLDQNPDTIPDNTIESENETITIPVSANIDYTKPIYVHVKAIDNQNNQSETLHYAYDYKSINFKYTIYSGSNDNDLIFGGWKNTINGNVYSGKNILGSCSELYINGDADAASKITTAGWKSEISTTNASVKAPELPDFDTIILDSAGDYEEYDTNLDYNSDAVFIDKSIRSNGSIRFGDTSLSGNCYIIAKNDIKYDINTLNKNNNNKIVLYSENGDIVINGSDIEINGLLYAPHGNIIFNVNNLTVNGRIIADNVKFNGSQINVTGSDEDWDILK